MAISSGTLSLQEAVKGLSESRRGDQPAPEVVKDQPQQAVAESELDEDLEEQPLDADSESDDTGATLDEQQASDEGDEDPDSTAEGGTEDEGTPDEPTPGELRLADYTRKTQALAEQSKVLASGADQVNQRLTALDQEFESIDQMLMGNPPQMLPVETLRTDPAAYEEQRRAVEEFHALRQGLAARRQEIAEERKQAGQAERSTIIQTEGQKFVEAFKIKDDAAMNAKVGEVQQYLTTVGYGAPEIAGLVDHRAYVIADKARKWDELQAGKPGAKLKTSKAKVKDLPQSARRAPVKNVDKAQSRFNEALKHPENRNDVVNSAAKAYAEKKREAKAASK